MIIALFNNRPVEVLEVYRGADGRKAVVKALEGKPFVGGDRWPIWTEYATVDVSQLEAVYPLEAVHLTAAEAVR